LYARRQGGAPPTYCAWSVFAKDILNGSSFKPPNGEFWTWVIKGTTKTGKRISFIIELNVHEEDSDSEDDTLRDAVEEHHVSREQLFFDPGGRGVPTKPSVNYPNTS